MSGFQKGFWQSFRRGNKVKKQELDKFVRLASFKSDNTQKGLINESLTFCRKGSSLNPILFIKFIITWISTYAINVADDPMHLVQWKALDNCSTSVCCT